jgi:hypothetical protein
LDPVVFSIGNQFIKQQKLKNDSNFWVITFFFLIDGMQSKFLYPSYVGKNDRYKINLLWKIEMFLVWLVVNISTFFIDGRMDGNDVS